MATGPENKQDIANQLCEALKRTDMWNDITALKYIREPSGYPEEWIYIDFKDHPAARRVDVSADSGWTLIKDVIAALSHDKD